MEQHIYNIGYKCYRDISRHNIINICKELNTTFDSIYGIGHIFEPEPICEGGIIWRNWPGKNNTQYKTIRLHVRDWPWIKGDETTTWFGDNTTVIPHNTRKYRSVLKAFYGAPAWTLDELQIFSDIMYTYDIVFDKPPSEKYLTRRSNIQS